MKLLPLSVLLFFLLQVLPACNGQTKTPSKVQTGAATSTGKLVGGGCDGCELMFVGMPAMLHAVDTSAGWFEKGQKLIIKGTVYQRDGKTPAPGILLYYWQTDANGYYSPGPGAHEKAEKHGHLRGWVKTDAQGQYYIYTIRPAPYPSHNSPAHVHFSVKEPGIKEEYYIDDIVFDDDPLLTQENRKGLQHRGGNAIVKPTLRGGVQLVQRNIILGLNIPYYPVPSGAGK